MAPRLPPLNALRAFDVAARTKNFTAAADELCVSQGAVSRHVAQLEAFLGVALFRRDPRQVRLTAAGAAYAPAIRAAFEQMEQATRLVRDGAGRRPLRIKLFPSLAIKWLIPRLAEFHSLHPDVDVQIMTTPRLVRFDPDEDDLTIQIGNIPHPGVHYDPLIAVELAPVCSPPYLRRLPAARSAVDLLDHVLLSSVQRQGDWPFWLEHAGVTYSSSRGAIRFGNSALAYQAAIDGIGIAIAQTQLVVEDLASGRLVTAHDLLVPTGETYYLASCEAAHASEEVTAFREWIMTKQSGLSDQAPATAAD